MANSTEYKLKRQAAQTAFLDGTVDTAQLAAMFGVTQTTIQTWAKKGRWREMSKENRGLAQKAEIARTKAIIVALEEFAANPRDVNLQALVSLLRNEQNRVKPARELNDYIVKFLDQLTDFCLEKNYHGLLKELQSILYDLSDYLRLRNG
jgi:transposase